MEYTERRLIIITNYFGQKCKYRMVNPKQLGDKRVEFTAKIIKTLTCYVAK